MGANYVEEICEEIAPIGNHCGTQETWIGLGAKFVAILTRLQRQQGVILKDNSDLKSEVMQQQNTILELRKQLNTATEIHRLNFQTSISERLKPQKMTKIDQEPAAERSDQLQIQVDEVDTVTTDERSLITHCGQTDHLQDIKDEAETQSESDQVEQLHGSLLMKQVRSARIIESDGKRIKFALESIETNARNSQQQSKRYSCGECKKQFRYKSDFTIHFRIHTGEKPYVCKDCDVAFSKANSLKRHQRIHSDEKPYVCKNCGAAFSRAHNLKRHQRIHSDERPYVCKDCGFAFKHAANLKEHQRSHTGEKPYVCKHCGTSFSKASTLKRHQRIHSGERPYVCNDCGFAFKYAANLKEHQRLHTGERPYVCKVCGAAFIQAGNLASHQKTHSGERPYVCNDCGVAFKRGATLKRHQRIHTGGKPFSCDICKKSFRHKITLSRHMDTHRDKNLTSTTSAIRNSVKDQL